MTDDASHRPRPAADVDLGHPVRSFVTALLLVGAALVAMQWTGAVTPRLSTPGGDDGVTDGGRQFHMVRLENDGLMSVRVERLAVSSPGWEDTALSVLDPGSEPGSATASGADGGPAAPFTLDPGAPAARWVVISGRPTCPESTIQPHLSARVRTWWGVTRTVRLGSGGDPRGRSQPCG